MVILFSTELAEFQSVGPTMHVDPILLTMIGNGGALNLNSDQM